MSESNLLAYVAIAGVWLICVVMFTVTLWECMEEAKSKKEIYIYLGLFVFCFVFGPFALVFFYFLKLLSAARTKLRELKDAKSL